MTAQRILLNAAGEPERDRFSARANLLEALALYAAASFALWGLVAHLGTNLGSAAALWLGYALLGACGVYAVALAPWLHGDAPASWGLPRPFALWDHVRELDVPGRRRLAALATGLAAVVALALLRGWPNLLARLGVRRHSRDAFEWLTGSAAGTALGVALALAVLLPLLALAVRWDNLASSLRGLGRVALGLWGGVIALALAYAALTGDWLGFDPSQWFVVHPDRTGAIFYLLWGFAQQLLFLGYLNTRLRRGIGPWRRGPLSGRLATALLTGILFGLAHLPAALLSALTAVAGALLAWHFQADRTRNLFVMALIHGIAGTLFSLLLPISMDVGPGA